MKRLWIIACLIASLFLSSCGFWMEGERVSVEPYEQGSTGTEQKISKVTTYTQMRNALTMMVENGVRSGVLDVSEFTGGSAHLYADTAARYVTTSNPMGVYAVEEITYETGIRNGVEAIAFHIVYRYELPAILQIENVKTVEEGMELVDAALSKAEPYVVYRVSEYTDTDYLSWIADRVVQCPETIMESPEVRINTYPESGSDRIVRLDFTYKNSQSDLLEMQKKVQPVFTAAKLYVESGSQVREKYSQLYAFLMERFDYRIERSVTPSYSLLIEGAGDGEAFACVYAAMCKSADLECFVVNGTLEGAPRTWNVIRYQGAYYHLDLLYCMENGDFLPRRTSEMIGYTWDDASYPN